MEQHHDETLMKSRSASTCVRAGVRLYTKNAKRIFRQCWPFMLVYALASSLIGTLLLTHFTQALEMGPTLFLYYGCLQFVITSLLVAGGVSLLRQHHYTGAIASPARWLTFDGAALWRTCKAALFVLALLVGCYLTVVVAGIYLYVHLPGIAGKLLITLLLVIMAILLLPMEYVTMKYLVTNRPSYLRQLSAGYGTGMRYLGLIFVVTFICALIAMLASAIISLPATVITFAALQSGGGVMAGDPSGLPHHFTLLTAATLLLNFLLQAWLILLLLFPTYFVYGSIEKQEEERQTARRMTTGQ